MTDQIDSQVEALEQRIRMLRKQQSDELAERRKAVSPVYAFTLILVEDSWGRLADDSCCWYELRGQVLNVRELEAVGARPFEGAMRYLFNRLSGRFVVSGGGGSIFLHLTPDWRGNVDTEAFAELAEFVVNNPQGGMVTDIVERYRHKG